MVKYTVVPDILFIIHYYMIISYSQGWFNLADGTTYLNGTIKLELVL
ncbi:hypothetical protein BROC_02500 [Candidatus Brocadiaceae bacterium]|nr:hypothetical protein BROC_02500 [Candidatus Brocadiaceae bacterium]